MRRIHKPRLTVTVTVFRSERDLPGALDALTAFAARVHDRLEVECVFVVDGSPDGSEALLRRELAKPRSFSAQLHVLSRNFGASYAQRCALEKGTGDYFVPLPPDLQESLEVLAEAVGLLADGEHDVVIGTPVERADPWTARLSSGLYWALYRRLIDRSAPAAGVGFFAVTRAVRDQLVTLRARNSFLIGEVLWLGYRRAVLEYRKKARSGGVSSWSLARKLGYLRDSVVYGSLGPLRLFTALGALASLGAGGLAIAVLVSHLRGEIHVSGYTTIVILICLFGGLTVLGIGIVGEYLGRVLENVRDRPFSIVARSYDFPTRDEKAAIASRGR